MYVLNNICYFSIYSVPGRTLVHWAAWFWSYGTYAAQYDSKYFQKHHSFKFQAEENVLQK